MIGDCELASLLPFENFVGIYLWARLQIQQRQTKLECGSLGGGGGLGRISRRHMHNGISADSRALTRYRVALRAAKSADCR